MIEVHLADRFALPAPYRARPYRGPADHPAITEILTAYREVLGDPELPTVDQIDVAYAHLDDCDPDTDVYVLEVDDGTPVGYGRASFEDLVDDEGGLRDCVVFGPMLPAHLGRELYEAVVVGQEVHMRPWAAEAGRARFRAFAAHPGPERAATGEAAWLETLGYRATEWGAALVRPHLDDIPERALPDGVELRPVTPDRLRTIVDAHFEAFRGEWDFTERTENDVAELLDEPTRDESMWKVAWAGDTVVGQVQSYINHEENASRGYLRGYTENISVHRDWRHRGIAGTLLAWSLEELKRRGMTQAALSVDTNNPGGAFQLYTTLGFELQTYSVVYTKPA